MVEYRSRNMDELASDPKLMAKYDQGNLDDLLVQTATLNSILVGFVVGQYDNNTLNVLGLHVGSLFSQLGVKFGLLSALAEQADQLQYEGELVYTLKLPRKESAQLKIYQDAGWAISECLGIDCSILVASALSAKWFRNLKLDGDYKAVLWCDITNAQRQAIKARHQSMQGGWYPPELDPFKGGAFEPNSSFALAAKKCEAIMGWLITQPSNEHIISFDIAFVDPSLQGIARVFILWVVGFKALEKSQYDTVWFSTSKDFPQMISIVERRMEPWMSSLRHRWEVRKRLSGTKTSTLTRI